MYPYAIRAHGLAAMTTPSQGVGQEFECLETKSALISLRTNFSLGPLFFPIDSLLRFINKYRLPLFQVIKLEDGEKGTDFTLSPEELARISQLEVSRPLYGLVVTDPKSFETEGPKPWNSKLPPQAAGNVSDMHTCFDTIERIIAANRDPDAIVRDNYGYTNNF